MIPILDETDKLVGPCLRNQICDFDCKYVSSENDESHYHELRQAARDQNGPSLKRPGKTAFRAVRLRRSYHAGIRIRIIMKHQKTTGSE
jgi:hypothetical protein